ncbi:DUF1501 domain-containing protein [Rhizobacter sp. Root404]|uniref:DUF1501 domain-containing protein n=1 Tax=Rhizobacter sp. Root404 TaxID=1736528 RepID=UPI0006FDBF4B|nr:DUF1501 domain-containing protein [Rhizobacter sp. Root404]KQW36137.1 hypothetical protein ASC76_15570 [Rhizobacter sp. Root404]
MNPVDPNALRRRLLAGALAAAALAPAATLSFAGSGAKDERRFVLVILRGGLDGLSAVPAIGDPDFAAARGPLAQFGAAPLALPDTPFALHPQLAQLHAMYGRGELTVLHAVGLPYRDRSHFDAQQVLESGGTRPYELSTGWLGRALAPSNAKALALNTAVPLVLRGPGIVDTWAPSALPDPGADLVARLGRMYANDPPLATALERARSLHAENAMAGDAMAPSGPRGGNFTVLATRAAAFLGAPDGPQAAVLELGGWDTHANQANPTGALTGNLRQLDAGLAALRDGLVSTGAWKRTVIVVATEFGREVAVNGTLGTDHGTGAAAFVLGGAVNGGRVHAEWPGLAKRDRNDGRDLKITTDLRAVLRSVLADHLQLASRALDNDVFPGSGALKHVALLKA